VTAGGDKVWGAAVFTIATEQPAILTLEVESPSHSFGVRFPDTALDHQAPLLGLLSATQYAVRASVSCGGEEHGLPSVSFRTREADYPFPDVELLAHEPGRMEPGLTLIDLESKGNWTGVVVLDDQARPVWVWPTEDTVADARLTEAGTVLALVGSDVVEVTLFGEEVARFAPESGSRGTAVALPDLHHEVYPRSGGGFFGLSRAAVEVADYPTDYVPGAPTQAETIEDAVVVEVDADGEVVWRQSLAALIDPSRIGYQSLQDAVLGLDWAHANGVVYLEEEDAFVVSARHQDAVVKFGRDGAIDWIFGHHFGWTEAHRAKLLEPVGDPFAWPFHQHAPMLTRDGSLVVFDNGNHGRQSPYEDVQIVEETNHSRVAGFRVQGQQVEQMWDFVDTSTGLEFSSAFGDADLLDGGTVIAVFGFLFSEGGVGNDTAGLGTKSARIVEFETATGELVWEVGFRGQADEAPGGWQVHRAQRLPSLYVGAQAL
jgi:arylsulfate sulfotransferase